MKPARAVVLSLLAGVLAGAPPLLAQEQPLVVGEGGVPVPKKTKAVKPVYPAEALAQGLRGIVILDLLIDATGHVASTTVVRSVPGLDEAAIAAAKQWEYEPTRVGGKAVSVRLTVPITFTLALPALDRDSGIPELRQGVSPVFPQGASGGANVAAEVTLEGDVPGDLFVLGCNGNAQRNDGLVLRFKGIFFCSYDGPEDLDLSATDRAKFVFVKPVATL